MQFGGYFFIRNFPFPMNFIVDSKIMSIFLNFTVQDILADNCKSGIEFPVQKRKCFE